MATITMKITRYYIDTDERLDASELSLTAFEVRDREFYYVQSRKPASRRFVASRWAVAVQLVF